MDQDTMNVVKEVVEDLTAKGELFSCFDVTRQLRDEKSLTVYHSEVRKQVHAMYANLGMPVDYERDDVTLPNGQTTCVFHPRSKLLTEYDPSKFGKDADPFGTKPTTTQQPSSQTAAPNQTQTDKRGRFCISNKFTKQQNVARGDRVFVSIDPSNSKIVIGHNAYQAPGTIIKSYQVDKDGNIRLAKRVLTRAGLVGKALQVSIDGSTIVVE